MYAEALLGDSGGASTPMIPRSAVQNVGDRTVVYLVNPKEPGTFVEREVRLGTATGDQRLGPGGRPDRAMWWSGKAVFLCAPSVNASDCERPLRAPREQRGRRRPRGQASRRAT